MQESNPHSWRYWIKNANENEREDCSRKSSHSRTPMATISLQGLVVATILLFVTNSRLTSVHPKESLHNCCAKKPTLPGKVTVIWSVQEGFS